MAFQDPYPEMCGCGCGNLVAPSAEDIGSEPTYVPPNAPEIVINIPGIIIIL